MERMGAATAGRATTPNGVATHEEYLTRAAKRKDDRKAALAAVVAKAALSNPLVLSARAGSVTDEERIAWEERTGRAQRAKDAQSGGQRKRHSRANRPPPPPSRLYAPAISCDAARDERLSSGAVRCLQLIQAVQRGRKPRISKSWLAMQLHVHVRTVQRYLSQLRETHYIETDPIFNSAGWMIGQIVRVTKSVLPYFFRKRKEICGKLGETKLSPKQIPSGSVTTSKSSPDKIFSRMTSCFQGETP